MILSQEPIAQSRTQRQFMKMIDIDKVGLFTNQFLLGYIANHIKAGAHPLDWRNLWEKLQFLKQMVISKNISLPDVIHIVQMALLRPLDENIFKESTIQSVIDRIGKSYDDVVHKATTSRKKSDPNQKLDHQKKYFFNQIRPHTPKRIFSSPNQKKAQQMQKKNQRLIQQPAQKKRKWELELVNPERKEDFYEQKIKRYNPPEMIQIKESRRTTPQKNPPPSFLTNLPQKKRISLISDNREGQQKEQKKQSMKNEIKQPIRPIKEYYPIRKYYQYYYPSKVSQFSESNKKKKQEQSSEKKKQQEEFPQKRKSTILQLKKQLAKTMNESSLLLKKSSQQASKKEIKHENEGVDTSIGINCSICCQQILFSDACPVSCGHILHKTCLNQYFKSKVEVKSFPILCPEQGCTQELAIEDIQEYVDKKIIDKFYEFSLHMFVDQNSSTVSWCPTAGCSAIFSAEANLQQYDCPSCKQSYCLLCRSAAHEGLTCEQNRQINNLPEEDKTFVNFAKGAKYKQCPSCKFWVERNKGCNHMTCRCHYQFCYKCGREFQVCNCSQSDYSDYSDY